MSYNLTYQIAFYAEANLLIKFMAFTCKLLKCKNMNNIILVHVLSIQTEQNETSNNKGASFRLKKQKLAPAEKTFTLDILYNKMC